MDELQIIVSKTMCFTGTDFSEHQNLIDEALNLGHIVSSISYIHGIAEDVMGYDIGACLNAELFLNRKHNPIEGIYDAKIIGYNNPCKAYIWRTKYNDYKCLIVDITDSEDVKYAQKCYSDKEECL